MAQSRQKANSRIDGAHIVLVELRATGARALANVRDSGSFRP